jgi:NAD(P)-dependent dehydrogenase (short-subunit alcohol dehydrogenase family)
MSVVLDLSDSIALVIGGSSGLGREIARGLHQAGAHTLIVGKTPQKVDAVVAALREDGGASHGYVADVSRISDLESVLARIAKEHGAIDILVNSQGTTELKPAEDFTFEEYSSIIDTNLTSVFFASTIVGRSMLARGKGCIINITSIAAHIGFPLSSVYDVSKHGVLGLTRTLAVEWATRGVRVNAIAPGVFITPLNSERMSSKRREGFLQRTPMLRFGDLPEIAGAALYLASPAASYVTGSTITVDGGYTAAAL